MSCFENVKMIMFVEMRRTWRDFVIS